MPVSQYRAHQPVPQAFSDSKPSALFPIGMPADAVRYGSASNDVTGFARFVYAAGSNVTAAGQWVHLSNGSAVLLAAANSASKLPVGVACAPLSAGAYGFVQVQGYCDYARGTNSSVGAGAPLYIAAGTAGLLLSNVVAGNQVLGVVPMTSYTSSQSFLSVALNNPFVAGVTASL